MNFLLRLCGVLDWGSYITHMNKFIILDKDNLDEYMDLENLVVAYSQQGCGGCVKVHPLLKKLDDKYTVVVSDINKYPESTLFKTDGINFVPTFGLFNKGSYIRELSLLDIKHELNKSK